MELPSPDDISAILETPFVTIYWPLILGGIAGIAALFRGVNWLLVPIIAAALFGQAWHTGYIG
jgi:hypothetical protein